MAIDFTAIDFETANRHMASACSVGLVKIRSGKVVSEASWFIRPNDELGGFDSFNSRLHGITAETVTGAPEWSTQLPEMLDFIEGDTVIAHNAGFDMGVIQAACKLNIDPTPKIKYLCSVKVSRKTYDLASHSLPYAASAAGFDELNHHDALSDAVACASIIIDAARIHEQDTVQGLAKTLGIQIPTLKALPIDLR